MGCEEVGTGDDLVIQVPEASRPTDTEALELHFRELEAQLANGLITIEELRQRVDELEVLLFLAYEANSMLAEQGTRDGMTGLLNRQATEAEIGRLHMETSRYLAGEGTERRKIEVARHFSILFIDIDNFKQINSAYGHAMGDIILILVARVLQANVRRNDIVGRWGGEEFLVGLLGADTLVAEEIAEKIRNLISNISHEEIIPLAVERDIKILALDALKVTASIGLATLQPDMSLGRFINEANTAMNDAKTDGKDTVRARQYAVTIDARPEYGSSEDLGHS